MGMVQYYEKMYQQNPLYKGGFEDGTGNMRFKKIIALIKKHLSEKEFKNWRILDVGCSTGELLAFLRPYFKDFAAIDISKTAVEKTKEKGFKEIYQLNIEHEKLPFDDNSFDLVFALEIIEHLFESENLITEIKRVLKPNGFLFLSAPNDILNWRKRLKIIFGKIPFAFQNNGHIRFFQKNSLSKIIKDSGFKILKSGGLPLSYKEISFGLLGKILVEAVPDFFASNYFIIAQK